MNKKILVTVFVSMFIVYTVYLRLGNNIISYIRQGDDDAGVITAPLPAANTTTAPATTTTKPAPVPPANTTVPTTTTTTTTTTSPVTTPVTTGRYRNGTYTGSVADAYYGLVQVKAIISGGKITDVQFLQYPNDRRTSIEINTQAMPILTSEAIQAQSAPVDIVSGASETSRAFNESLASALALAAN